jgi:hypothetical protein
MAQILKKFTLTSLTGTTATLTLTTGTGKVDLPEDTTISQIVLTTCGPSFWQQNYDYLVHVDLNT